MDLSAITPINGLGTVTDVSPSGRTSFTGVLTEKNDAAEGTLFDSFLNSAINNIKTTNEYLSDAEDMNIKFAKHHLLKKLYFHALPVSVVCFLSHLSKISQQ